MSDMLEKLLNVEKTAASLISEAETEARRRTSAARVEAQKTHAEILKTRAAKAERAVEIARKDSAAEREQKNAEYRQSLSRKTPDRDAFSRAVLGFFEKGGT
jgi:F0F1-type ATP synthase membrane subunit b/b'